MVVKAAMTTMKHGIRTLSGIWDLSIEISALESVSTKVVAKPIPNPFCAEEVTAKVGHIPKIKEKVGLSLSNPLLKFCQ